MASIPASGMGPSDAPANIGDAVASRARKLTPKRPQAEKDGLADVFPYYAGFSFAWAKEQLKFEADSDKSVILDPWNGSGTTTLAARANGIRSIGADLNPIANIVARLRAQVGSDLKPSSEPAISRVRLQAEDPLLFWFSPKTASRLRQWSRYLGTLPQAESILGYVALFRVVRSLTSVFEGSNPTWVRRASTESELVDVARKRLDELIVHDQERVRARLADDIYRVTPVSIIEASSKRIPLANETVDFILTSPPYLTRIDYAVAYSRELAVCDINIVSDRSLRSALMGTTLIRPPQERVQVYGKVAGDLVADIAAHSSKASSGYYLKQARQYLDDLVESLGEITRVSKKHAILKLVVQDSYYKDIPIRLAEICAEEAEKRGWIKVGWESAEVTRHLTQVNTAARAYTKGRVDETVITLRKAQ